MVNNCYLARTSSVEVFSRQGSAFRAQAVGPLHDRGRARAHSASQVRAPSPLVLGAGARPLRHRAL